METQAQILPGYPDFWPVAFSEYQKFFEAAEKTEPLINEIYSVGQSEPLHKVLRHLSKMVANSFSGLLVLGINGFGYDAMKLARGMFETALIAAYLRQHPEEFDDYMDFHWVSAMKRHRYVEKHAPELLKNIKPEAIETIKINYDRVSARFKDRNGKVRSRWSKKSFAQIAEELGVAANYETFYRFASSMQHGDISGLMMQMDPEEGVLDVNIAPSMDWVGEALISGHTALVVAVMEYVDACLQDKISLAKQLEKDFVHAWKS